MGPAIRSEAIAKRFGTFEALSDLTFEVEEGSITGFLGLNGAGKTTMLRILAGLSTPTRGSAEVLGRPVVRSDIEGRKLVGVVPDVPAFHGWMTAREVLRYVSSLLGGYDWNPEQRIASLLDVAGLTPAADRRVAGFSRGMKQRLGIAQALVANPPVLLLDEPVSALDPAGRRDVLDLIDRLHGKRTVFFSTHILADVERICDAVVVIHKGRVVAQSSVAGLRNTLTTNALEIEVTGDASRLTAALNAAPYVERTEVEAFDARTKIVVWPKDLDAAQARVPSLLAIDGMVVGRYEWVTPDLEAVFLNLVGDTGPRTFGGGA